MGIIRDLFPVNYREEKSKFWLDFSYNPQFHYVRDFTNDELTKWGKPKRELHEHGLKMLAKSWHESVVTNPISQQEIIDRIAEFNTTHTFKKNVTVSFSSLIHAGSLVANGEIIFKIPIKYSHEMFEDLIRHELDTHFIRRYNHKQEPWKDVIFPDEVLRRTEEGLAILHTHLERKNKVMYKSYLNYVATYLAQNESFSSVFNTLRTMGMNSEKAWLITVRVKRGLTDTSKPGGITKDICYLEGAIQVWEWLQNRKHDPHDLYLGRVPISEIAKLKPQSDLSLLQYPSFFDNIDTYLDNIQQIGEANHFSGLTTYANA